MLSLSDPITFIVPIAGFELQDRLTYIAMRKAGEVSCEEYAVALTKRWSHYSCAAPVAPPRPLSCCQTMMDPHPACCGQT